MSATGNETGHTGRIGTRSSNSSKHPGLANKTTLRRTSVEVKAAAKAKEAAKKAKKEAHEARIHRVAEFESREKTNEEQTDATPRPDFATRDSEISDGHSLAPPGESDDSDSVKPAEMPVPKARGRKKGIPAARRKELASIAEKPRDESEPVLSKKTQASTRKRPIMEETDTDGDGPPLRNWKPKAKRDGFTASKETPDEPEDFAADEEKNLPPPSKKPRNSNVKEKDSEAGRRKKKESIRDAIAAIQQATSADSGQASEKRGEDEVTAVEGGKKSKSSGGKRFGDGPQLNRQGEKNGGRSLIKRPNQNKDQIGLPGDAT